MKLSCLLNFKWILFLCITHIKYGSGESGDYESSYQSGELDYFSKVIDCGRTPIKPNLNTDMNITEAVPYSWPWAVFFCKQGGKECSDDFYPGTLISREWIITGAKTVKYFNQSKFSIYFGVHKRSLANKEPGSFKRNILEVYVNPKFSEETFSDGIALVKISGRPIPLSDHVQPVCLTRRPNDFAKEGKPIYTIGRRYYTNRDDELPKLDALAQFRTELLDLSVCKRTNFQFTLETSICLSQEFGEMSYFGTPVLAKSDKNQRWYMIGTITRRIEAPSPGPYNLVQCDSFIADLAGQAVCNGDRAGPPKPDEPTTTGPPKTEKPTTTGPPTTNASATTVVGPSKTNASATTGPPKTNAPATTGPPNTNASAASGEKLMAERRRFQRGNGERPCKKKCICERVRHRRRTGRKLRHKNRDDERVYNRRNM